MDFGIDIESLLGGGGGGGGGKSHHKHSLVTWQNINTGKRTNKHICCSCKEGTVAVLSQSKLTRNALTCSPYHLVQTCTSACHLIMYHFSKTFAKQEMEEFCTCMTS